MEERVRSWFRRAPTTDNDNNDQQQQFQPISLLANWKAYVSLPSSAITRVDDSSQIQMDVESGSGSGSGSGSVADSLAPFLRSANETLFGTFNIVSKGVRDLPGNVQLAASSFPSGKALVYFGLLMATGIFFIFLAVILFLPVMVVMPQKFALSFTLGCLFIILSFFALKGPKTQLLHMVSKERLSFTIGFVASMAATIYVSMVLHSYLLSVIFSGVQVLALVYYVISYFPGGSSGIKLQLPVRYSFITHRGARYNRNHVKTNGTMERQFWKYNLEAFMRGINITWAYFIRVLTTVFARLMECLTHLPNFYLLIELVNAGQKPPSDLDLVYRNGPNGLSLLQGLTSNVVSFILNIAIIWGPYWKNKKNVAN